MQVKIITLAFDEKLGVFDEVPLEEFCRDKLVRDVKARFLLMDGRPYWSLALVYEPQGVQKGQNPELDSTQKALFMELKSWRKRKAQQEGYPVYLVATNAQLIQMILGKFDSVAGLSNVKGYGKAKIGKYGEEIITLLQDFYKKHGT